MISRRPTWMLLVTCALLSCSSSLALAASQEGQWSQGTESRQGELLLSQATESAAEESYREEPEKALDRPTLSLGSSGPLVIQIQVLLQKQGLYSGTIDGDFNADTVKAVKEFQTEKGLEPTGSVDSSTWGPLTGEIAEPEAATVEEEALPSPEAAASDASPSTSLRLLIAVAALVGLGAGGFGLWKMLSVPVPQPLAYGDGGDDDDDYMDDLNGGQGYSPDSMPSRRGNANGQEGSPITVPASPRALSPQVAALAEEMAQESDIAEEQVDFSGLEEMGLTESPPLIPQPLTPASIDTAPAVQASTQQGVHSAGAVEMHGAEVQIVREEIDATQAAAHPPEIALQQAVVQDATGQNLADAQIAADQAKRKPESATDTAVAIATQTARAAARQKAYTVQAPKPLPKTVQSMAKAVPAQPSSRASQAVGQRKPSLAQASGSTPGKKQARQAVHPLPPPPPAPSEIVRSAPASVLEQPELVTTPLMGRVDIVETLITDLQGADPAKRRKAIWELGQRCDSRAIQPLVNMMGNSDSRQRSLILAALSEIGTQTLKPMKQALAISLQDDNAEVRKNAIRDLTRIYDLVAQISHLLNSALDDPDPEVQETARWALKQLNRIRSNAGLEGSPDHPILQQSVSPPESFSGEVTRKPRSLPKA